MSSEQIGFLGLGLMGHGMAKNIVEKGYPLTVLGHRNRAPVEDLVKRGAKEAKSAREKALRLAGRMIEWDPAVRCGQGLEIARDILASGRALRRMNAIIAAQGATGFDYRHPALGERSFEVLAPASGVVTLINNQQLARIAGHAGAPKVKSAGVDLCCKLGQTVARGEVLYRVYARYPADLEFARKACQTSSGYAIGAAQDVPQVSVEF